MIHGITKGIARSKLHLPQILAIAAALFLSFSAVFIYMLYTYAGGIRSAAIGALAPLTVVVWLYHIITREASTAMPSLLLVDEDHNLDDAKIRKQRGIIRCVHVSDTHNKHAGVDVPSGDVLIHTGDFTKKGTVDEFIQFNAWLGTLPHKHKIIIAGNHDFIADTEWYYEKEGWKGWHKNVEKMEEVRGRKTRADAALLLSNAIYLEHEERQIAGLRVFGSPYQPGIPGRDMAFNRDRDSPQLDELWQEIPAGLDLLLTHGPPMGVLDQTFFGKHVGCEKLYNRLKHLGGEKAGPGQGKQWDSLI